MRKTVQVIEFRLDQPEAVVEEMDRLAQMHEGWVNLRPAIPPEDEPPRSSPITMLFSSGIHEVPICTWVTGKLGRHGGEVGPDSLGVQHATGTRTAANLRSLGVAVPHGWRAVQDHPRRGLVVLAPAGTQHADELSWLLQAGTVLSRVTLTGEWVAEVHSKS